MRIKTDTALDCLGMLYVLCSWENMGTADNREKAKEKIISFARGKTHIRKNWLLNFKNRC